MITRSKTRLMKNRQPTIQKHIKKELKKCTKNQTKIDSTGKKKYQKKSIPKALKDQVWITYNGYKFEAKCYVSWCTNVISAFNFHAGHNIPESKGGELSLENLRPICSTCNSSMKDNYTIDEWNNMGWKKIKNQEKYPNLILFMKIMSLLGVFMLLYWG